MHVQKKKIEIEILKFKGERCKMLRQILELINTDTALVVSLPILISQPRIPKTQKMLLVIDDLKTPIK